MQHSRPVPPLLLLLVLAACGEDQPPTSPTPDGSTGPVLSNTATHKVVNSPADPGNGTCNATQCTLREAINAAGSTEISFAPGLTGPITLASPTAGGGTLGIDKDLSITGPSGKIVIQRRSTDPDFRIFRIGSATVTLRNLAIRNGKADRGGGIRNSGTLRLINSSVVANSTTDRGGGIINFGTLRLINSTVARNSANSGIGGIANQNNATLTLANSTVAENSGGGITNNGGTLALNNSTVTNNSSLGIHILRGTATLDRATITGNESGGIEAGKASVTLTNSTVAGNKGGGGVANYGGTFTISKSTISNNSATDGGGGVYSEADDVFCRISALVTITNSTISGNTARFGGGIANRGCGLSPQVDVTNTTIVRNVATVRGGGVLDESDEGFTRLTNSIVAQNSAPTGPQVFGAGGSSNLIGGDPKIDALAKNGGPTRTHALRAGSPAINAASTSECPPTDQRGVPRPQGPACDMGSYERQ